MATFTSTTNGNLADGATYGNTSPGVRGTDFPGDDDVLVVASGHTVTMNADATIGSVDIQGTLTTDGTARTLTLDDGGQGYICEHRGTITTTINLTINSNYEGNRLIRLNGTSGNFNDVSITLQSTSRVLEYVMNTTIDGDLSIPMGKLQSYSPLYSLTVTKACTVGNSGKLNLGGSTVSLGTINVNNSANAEITFSSATTTITLNPNSTHPTWGFSLGSAATVNFNSGTIKFAKVDSGTRYLQMGGQGVHVLNDVIIDTNHNIPWASHFEAASLDIQDGELNSYGGSDGITITGDLTIGNGTDAAALTYTADSNGFHDQSFGGIKLKNNGTLDGTNQTMTVTNRYTGESHLWKNDGGTFNHNNGTVKFNDNDHSAVKENTFYNVEVASNLGDYAVSFEAQGGGGNAFTILGDLTISRGDFELVNADDTCDIHGQTIISGSSNSAARFNNDKNQTATITHHGLVTIIQGTYHVEDGATVNMAGIRNVGGLVD